MINLKTERMTDEEISSNLRLDGFSWCYFETAKGKHGLYLVPTLRSSVDFPVEIVVFGEKEEDGKTIQTTEFEQCINVPKKQWADFFNSIVDQLNSI